MDETATLACASPDAAHEASESPRPRLNCLGPPRLEVFGQWLDLTGHLDSPPVEVLLRVAAAGPQGASAPVVEAALWPQSHPRTRRARLNECLRSLAVLVAGGKEPVVLQGERLRIDPLRLQVDALELEECIAPLLVPYAHVPRDRSAVARTALANALSRQSVFLPGVDAPWAVAARMRTADALARATRSLASE